MAGFFNGPAAQLVGMGMQAVGVGIPISETCGKVIDEIRNNGMPLPPNTWFRPKEQIQKNYSETKNVYNKLEEHINGMMMVVKSTIELKNVVQSACKSADRNTRRDKNLSPRENIRYYTPQKVLPSSCKNSAVRKFNSPQKKQFKISQKNCVDDKYNRARDDFKDDDCCMYCSSSSSLFEFACGRLVCSKCDEIEDHDLECKQCKKLIS